MASLHSLNQRALSLYQEKQFRKAHQVYSEILKKVPPLHRSEVWNNLGLCSSNFQIPQAIKEYQQAIQAGNENARWNLCVLYLSELEFPKAWALWDSRFKATYSTSCRFTQLPIPYLQVEEVSHHTGPQLCVLQEQGIGDELLFLTVLPEIAPQFDSIIWQTSSVVGDLLQLVDLPKHVHIWPSLQLPSEMVYASSAYTYAGNLFAAKRPSRASFSAFHPFSANLEEKINTWKPQLPPHFTAIQAFTNPLAPNAHDKTIPVPEPHEYGPLVSLNHQKMPYPDHVIQPPIHGLGDVAAIVTLSQNTLLASSAISQLCGFLGLPAQVFVPHHRDQWRFFMKTPKNVSEVFPSLQIHLR